MNDFTKEELIELKSCTSNEKLRIKLIDMIDDYCEHEWENICCQCTMDKIYCHKCEKDMGDLKERYYE